MNQLQKYKLMKRFLIVILLFSVTFCSFAQKQDKKSKIILENLANKTNSYKNIKIDFVYKMENKSANIDESREGTIIIKGNKYKIDMGAQQIFCDGETLWTYLVDDEEVMINSVEEGEDSFSPKDLLSSYTKNYNSNFIKERKKNDIIVQVVVLKPITEKTYSKVKLLIDKEKKQLISSTIFDKNGSKYIYQIKKFETNIDNINDADFIFDTKKYPDVEINDMR